MSRTCLTFSLAALVACACFAQPKPPAAPTMISVLVSKVKPDMTQEFEKIQKNELLPALKKGGTPWRSFSQTMFGDLNTFVSVTPIEKFAQYDGESGLTKALGQEGVRALLTKLSKSVNETRRYAVLLRPDLSIMRPDAPPSPYSVIAFVRVAPGKRLDFEKLVKSDVLPVMRKMEYDTYLAHETLFGGDANEWVFVTGIKKMADLDTGSPFVKVLGQAGADKLMMKTAGIISSVERIVSRSRPELSLVPAK
jgi:hypothetical protein